MPWRRTDPQTTVGSAMSEDTLRFDPSFLFTLTLSAEKHHRLDKENIILWRHNMQHCISHGSPHFGSQVFTFQLRNLFIL